MGSVAFVLTLVLAAMISLKGSYVPEIDILKGLTPVRDEDGWIYYSVPLSADDAESKCLAQFPNADVGGVDVATKVTVIGKAEGPISIPQLEWSNSYMTLNDKDCSIEFDESGKSKTRCLVRVLRRPPPWLAWIEKLIGRNPEQP